ncbi:NUDIX domain-containing protein [Methylobacterium gregans]|uniref:RNA pyrophosphohydrolase n=1 Tax=Methylobacterium gregans TaxID=374424 RepID=A0AA37MB02_9HYPH|nr:NUDIX domain-containing protein [Methylobacterium gregans]MDQ0521130.1 ADP-ribose pyrophosphatase YjhB (NUDIX family) [Methylobacterium gregans]GJD79142.1 RNA pyrophosphohydrolase [Methylobacterium gregans]GLS54295.1 NUDIX hydrolase [Methylobacterium gregans]
MSDFADSYLGELRRLVGSRLLLVPGTRVVVTDAAGRILLEQRSDFRLWGLPGGVPDAGEDITACAVREVFEETGLRICDPVPFGFASAPEHELWTYPSGDRCHYFTLLYAAGAGPGPLRPAGGENLELGWFEPESPPDLMPAMARTLDAYRRWRETGTFQML